MAQETAAVKRRFESKVDSSGEHHLWRGALDPVRGTGRAKHEGRNVTAHRLAWELFVGDVPLGSKVLACPDEPACVCVEHLRLTDESGIRAGVRAAPVRRQAKGAGSMAEVRDGVFKLTVTAGAHDDGRQRRVVRRVQASKPQAAKLLAALVDEVGDGSRVATPQAKDMTVDELLRAYLAACTETSDENPKALAHSTLVRYEDLRKNWLTPALGLMKVRALSEADIDRVFAVMRNSGKSHSHMNQAKSLLNGALRWARRRRIIARNPMADFELPRSKQVKREVIPPEVDDLIKLLNSAHEHEPELAPVLSLAATTGLRRGELAGLRRDRIDFDGSRLRIDTAVNDAGGAVVIKSTKTHQARWLAIDSATMLMLARHLVAMDERARACGVVIADDAFAFSLDLDCSTPMRPEFMTRHMRALRAKLALSNGNFDASILALRKFTTTELMDAGFNPSAVSGRQGHTVQVMLAHYSKRRTSADIAAAEHLGRVVFGSAEPGVLG